LKRGGNLNFIKSVPIKSNRTSRQDESPSIIPLVKPPFAIPKLYPKENESNVDRKEG
jgi:hypothetical protein